MSIPRINVERAEILSRFISSVSTATPQKPEGDPNNTPSHAHLIQQIANPDTVNFIRGILDAINLADRSSRISNELLDFISLVEKEAFDVRTVATGDNQFCQEYYLVNQARPLVRINYSIVNQNGKSSLEPQQLEIESKSGNETIQFSGITTFLAEDKTKQILQSVLSNHQSFKYLLEFINLKDKTISDRGEQLVISAQRTTGKNPPFLVVVLEKTAEGDLNFSQFGKAQQASATELKETISISLSDQLKLVKIAQKMINSSLKSGLGLVDLDLIANAANIKAKALGELNKHLMLEQTRARSNPTSIQAPIRPKSIRDFMSSSDVKIYDQAEEQKQSLIRSLKELLTQRSVQLKMQTEIERVQGILGLEERDLHSITIQVPAEYKPVDLNINCRVLRDRVEVKDINLPKLAIEDPILHKPKPILIDLREAMDEETLALINSQITPKLTDYLINHHQVIVDQFIQELTKLSKIILTNFEGRNFGKLDGDKYSFVFEFDEKQRTITRLARLPYIIEFKGKGLSHSLQCAESYVYGKVGGGNEAYSGGGVPLLCLSQDRKEQVKSTLESKEISMV